MPFPPRARYCNHRRRGQGTPRAAGPRRKLARRTGVDARDSTPAVAWLHLRHRRGAPAARRCPTEQSCSSWIAEAAGMAASRVARAFGSRLCGSARPASFRTGGRATLALLAWSGATGWHALEVVAETAETAGTAGAAASARPSLFALQRVTAGGIRSDVLLVVVAEAAGMVGAGELGRPPSVPVPASHPRPGRR